MAVAADAAGAGGTQAALHLPGDQQRRSATLDTTGTLRWAIAQANAATSPSAIEFELGSAPATITLSQGQLELSNTSDATTIYDGPGEGAVTVSGNNASRVFQVDAVSPRRSRD